MKLLAREPTARVIITRDCDKDCPLCCMKDPTTLEQIKPLQSLEMLSGYGTVVLTGGEPTLHLARLIRIIRRLRENNPEVRIYIYSASYKTQWLPYVVESINGVTYTIHSNEDVKDFLAYQRALQSLRSMARSAMPCSYRLSLDTGITADVPLIPELHDVIRIYEWLDPCPIVENETLYELVGEVE